VIRRGPLAGQAFPVEIDSTFNSILEFKDATVSLILSLDVITPRLHPGELYGSDGILSLADPMFFSGETAVTKSGADRLPLDCTGLAFSKPNRRNHIGGAVADYRGVGLIDLALAIRNGRPNRTGADFIVHSVEVMEAIVTSARVRKPVQLKTSCERPQVLDPLADGDLIAFTPSPFDFDPAASDH